MNDAPVASNSKVGRCPKCDLDIAESHPYTWCIECGEPLPPDVQSRLRIWSAIQAGTAERAAQGLCPRCKQDRLVEVRSRRFHRKTPVVLAGAAGVLFAMGILSVAVAGPMSPGVIRLFGDVERLLGGAAAATWLWKKTEWKCPRCDLQAKPQVTPVGAGE